MNNFAKLIFISTGIILSISSGYSQVEDAILFSRTSIGGSARVIGVGGAQTALGGDISSALSNPAGLGMFNRSTFTFSPTLNFIGTNTDILGESTTDSKLKVTIPNLGVVFNKMKGDMVEGPFRGGSFAISFSRINDFNNQFSYQSATSNDDFFSFLYDQINVGENFYPDLAFEAFVLDEFFEVNQPGDTTYFLEYIDFDFDNELGPEIASLISETVETSGAQNQWSFSYGANLNDKFFIGAGLGILSLNYRQEKNYSEFRSEQSALGVLSLNETTQTSGLGVNATLGFIYRPIDLLQLGFSVVTPTYYSLETEFEASITSEFNNFLYQPENRILGVESALSDIFISEYRLTTPLKLNFGVAGFIGKQGFITADVEMINYANNKINTDDFTDLNTNNIISDTYESSFNVRLGGEFRSGIFRARGGLAFSQDPYKIDNPNDLNNPNVVVENNRLAISVGAGIRLKDKYFDFALVNARYKQPYTPYGAIGPIASVANSNVSAQFTAGFNF